MSNNKKILKLLLSAIFFIVLMAVAGIILVQIHFPIRHLDVVKAHAGNFEPALIFAVIHAESSFRPDVVSHAGAVGLMQVMEETGADMARIMGIPNFDPRMLRDPEYNIAIGSFYLNWLLQYLGEDITLILSGYNAGPGRVREWLADERFSEDGVTLTYIPFWETHNYVKRVERNMRIYEWLLWIYGLG